MSTKPTILIIGAGTFGVSTAHHLAHSYRDPSRITLIEQSPTPPHTAAAMDTTRIIRTDYPSRLYCELAFEALHAWWWHIDLCHHTHRTGWLMLDDSAGGERSKKIRRNFEERGSTQAVDIDVSDLKGSEARWEGVLASTSLPTSPLSPTSMYFNPEAAFTDAALATHAFLTSALNRGIRLVTARVTSLLHDARTNRITGIRTSTGETHTADITLLCAGAWSSSLLSPLEDALSIPTSHRLESQLQATGQVSAYYALEDEEAARLSDAKMPVVVLGGVGEVVPPSPSVGVEKSLRYNCRAVNVTNTITSASGAGVSVPPAEEEGWPQSYVPEGLKAKVRETGLLSAVLPEVTGSREVRRWRVCWDAETPTRDWLMCRHPDQKLGGLVVAGGGSFGGYKFLPNAGKYIANVLNGVSNGQEKDEAWGWKSGMEWEAKMEETRRRKLEIRDFLDGEDGQKYYDAEQQQVLVDRTVTIEGQSSARL